MKKVVLILLLMTALGSAGTFLCRIDFGPDQSSLQVAALGIPVLQEFDGYCLARPSDQDIRRLTRCGFALTILDSNPEVKEYYYVTVRPGFDRARLDVCGDLFYSDDNGVLLRTTEEALLELNRLPVSLCRIPMEPLAFSTEDNPVPAPARLVSDSLVQALVDRVSADSILAHINRLVAFYTRYSTTESCRRAVEWVQSRFQAYGCDSTALEIFRSNYAPNVIGCKFGRTNPRPIWVICGHVDNTSDYAPNRCPGSDDNASGSAAVIEACRVFAGIEFDQTVYFIGFTGEEQGLFGSDSWTRRAARRGDSIKAALNFDMISYGRENIDSFDVIGRSTNPNCAWLVDSFIANARRYTDLKPRRRLVTSGSANSDHYYFWVRGWPAFCGIEWDFTPEYHTIGDTVGPLYYRYCGTNNVPFATAATKAAVATIARFAGAHIPTAVAEPTTGKPYLTNAAPLLGRGPFRFQLAAGQRLELYNALGSPVWRTVVRKAGTVVWDGRDSYGRNLPRGTYFFCVRGPSVEHGRLTVVP